MNKRSLLVLGGLCLCPQWAWAHLVSTRFGEFYSGMLHPLTSLQHVVPWIALGLWAGIQKPTTARWALLAFPLGILIGLLVAQNFPEIGLFRLINLASFIVIGLLIALKTQTSINWFVPVFLIFGCSHGYANANPQLEDFDWLLYLIGVSAAAYLSITLMSAFTLLVTAYRNWATIAVRALGSWIAAAGIMYDAFLLSVT